MRQLKLGLSVLVMLTACGCSTVPSLPQTVLRQPPTACLTPCSLLPLPVSGSDRDVRSWEYQAVEQYGECRRLHADCIESTVLKE